LAVDEAAHNYGGGDANGNAAFAPRLPLKLAPPNRPWFSPCCSKLPAWANTICGWKQC